jgi:hypothetical protein
MYPKPHNGPTVKAVEITLRTPIYSSAPLPYISLMDGKHSSLLLLLQLVYSFRLGRNVMIR